MAPKETENNAYAKCWGDKQRALWYFLEWSIANTPLSMAVADLGEVPGGTGPHYF